MRSGLLALRAAGAAAILVAAPVYGATAAQAQDNVTATISSTVIAAQGHVQVKVEGCRHGRARVSSSAFVQAVTISSGSGDALYGDVSIKSFMAAGSYDISVSCDGHDHGHVGRFQVVDHGHDHGGYDHRRPYAPVHAGGGGTAVLAADAKNAAVPAEQSGPGTPYTVVGLVLAGVAAVTVAYRSSRRRRAAAVSASREAD
ncbi:hypothetical protein [Streptomyces sp. NRRL F-5126]|uniref:hypothetical protein n=1 Tax=Streptomyces sp. NRRL F-5126 TaxID=1463857 RepID=UPI0005620016|nr:hypothetical protein [Streptomyces sp. NRRL F-5126]